ncbi:hypothetical protein EYF80_032892 [Liparis tanakae]|uniref:Uncharacterized protein n=1 Tax=Liparis tanakae TaxID=230148 RepID=A0A4Z2GVX5_9TELE|nr:hypothetical protein EYF80_032892 [Liparis tanakae]
MAIRLQRLLLVPRPAGGDLLLHLSHSLVEELLQLRALLHHGVGQPLDVPQLPLPQAERFAELLQLLLAGGVDAERGLRLLLLSLRFPGFQFEGLLQGSFLGPQFRQLLSLGLHLSCVVFYYQLIRVLRERDEQRSPN